MSRNERIDAVLTPEYVIDGQTLLRTGKKRYRRLEIPVSEPDDEFQLLRQGSGKS